MEKDERVDRVGRRALEIFRRKEMVLSNRLEQKGLNPSAVIEIARCVNDAIEDFCEEYRKESKDKKGLFTALTRAGFQVDIFRRELTTERAEG